MASNINSTDIDALYPVAGQDNDSQGFRDNFSTIKNSFATAASEITALQDNTAKLNSANDFNGNNISEANFIANTEEVYAIGNITGNQNINWTNGHYQTVQAGADITLSLTDWPSADSLGKMRLAITSDGSSRTVRVAAGGAGTMKNDGNSNFSASGGTYVEVTAASTTNPHIIEFWTTDNGNLIFAHHLGLFS